MNNRIAGITEYQYTKRGGQWYAARSRTTLFDGAGHSTLISENDFTEGRQLSASSGVALRLHELLPFISHLAQPDELHAETTAAMDDESCWIEAANAATAAAAVIGQGALVTAAAATEEAAEITLAAAIATCPADPVGCVAAVAAATAALAAAQSTLSASQVVLATAIAAAATADAALWSCLHSSSSTISDAGGGASEDTGEWYCDYTIWYDDSGNVTEIDDDGCFEDIAVYSRSRI